MSGLSCLSITACHVPPDVLERLSYTRAELAGCLTSLRCNSRARAVAVLSTCQRTEVYATWPAEPDDQALLAALALDRGIPGRALRPVARTYRGDDAARHLLRVASGLESFVLGETEIAGQVRVAARIDVRRCRFRDALIAASIKRSSSTSAPPAARLMSAATRTCPAISVSPSTKDSRPLATRSR